MELHRSIPKEVEDLGPDLNGKPYEYFEKAYSLTKKFYFQELDRISNVRLENVDPEFFFKELIWVVHATGFSAKAVSKFISKLYAAYGTWSEVASKSAEELLNDVKVVCNNPQKIKAIHKTALFIMKQLKTQTWEEFRAEYLSTPELLAKLPYVGKITCYHLGRNIGLLDCVKPDLHLVRMASNWKFKDCLSMCMSIKKEHQKQTEEELPLGIVDLILWYGASTWSTTKIRKQGER